MRSGISGKLTATYVIIVIAMITSGLFCFYVLDRNQHANREMRYVTLPSISHLESLMAQNKEIKKLTNTRVYLSATKDQDRLVMIMDVGNPVLRRKLAREILQWRDSGEKSLYSKIDSINAQIYDSVRTVINLVTGPESYFNDDLVDRASGIDDNLALLFAKSDELLTKLIATKNLNLEAQQNGFVLLQRVLYFTIFATIILVVVISFFAWRYSKVKVVGPMLRLEKIIQNMAFGVVDEVPTTSRPDEIGSMQNAVSSMIQGVLRKIEFAEKLGKGSYDAGFNLLSEKDELGTALLSMRDKLNKANEELREHDHQLLVAQRMAKVGNYFVDVATGAVRSSEALDEILGIVSSQEKFLQVWINCIAPEYRDAFANEIARAQEKHEMSRITFKINRMNDGEERWVELIGDRIYNSDGTPKFLFGTIQDITHGKILELELSASYKMATEQNKRLLNFSYIVSHNLRMHAVNIHSLLKMVEESQDPDEVKEFFRMLNTASDMLNETMHHLNDVVAMQNAVNVDVKPLVLNDHIQHAFTVLNTQITQKSAQIYNHVKDDVIIHYNPAYLDSVILNFLSNAIKYSHPDRQPEIHIRCNRIQLQHSTSNWVLVISDNGIGIDLARHGSKLFGMYKTFHTNADAKGIGLFLTKYQIEAMGGSVEVESEPGKGTSFRIYFR